MDWNYWNDWVDWVDWVDWIDWIDWIFRMDCSQGGGGTEGNHPIHTNIFDASKLIPVSEDICLRHKKTDQEKSTH